MADLHTLFMTALHVVSLRTSTRPQLFIFLMLVSVHRRCRSDAVQQTELQSCLLKPSCQVGAGN